jgi:hypothetical protein
VKEMLLRWRGIELTEKDSISHDELAINEDRLSVKLPKALNEWLLMAGRRAEILTCIEPDDSFDGDQNILLPQRFHWRHIVYRDVFNPEAPPIDYGEFMEIAEIAGGMQTDTCGIARRDIHLDDPPVWNLSNWWLSKKESTYFSLSSMIVSYLLARLRYEPLAICLRCNTPEVLDKLIDAGSQTLGWKRWNWFREFFDPVSDCSYNQVYESIDYLVLRDYHPFHKNPWHSDRVTIFPRTEQAALHGLQTLMILDTPSLRKHLVCFPSALCQK